MGSATRTELACLRSAMGDRRNGIADLRSAIPTVIDDLTQPTPDMDWLASIDFDALKAKWAAEELQSQGAE